MASEAEQKAFEKVWDWFVVQGHPQSLDEDGDCVYRGADGARCAVSVLVTDEERDRLEEGHGIWDHSLSDLPSLKGLDMGWLTVLQDCHDGAFDGEWPEVIRRRLRSLAQHYDLAIPEAS